MRAIAIGLLTVITWTSHSWAYGSIARGYAGKSIRFIYVTDLPTGTDEQSSVISACTRQGLTSCEIVINFRDRCVSVATNPTGAYSTALGDTVERARINATTGCTAAYRSICADAVSICDQTPAIEPPEPNYDFSFLADPGFWRIVQTGWVATYGGTAVVVTLLLWLFLAILSAASPGVLKRRAALFAWIALPSFPIAAGWAFIPFHPIPGGGVGLTLLCWTVVFAALGAGSQLRWLVSHRKSVPDVLSLPLAVLLFSVVTICVFLPFLAYGIVPKPEDCDKRWILLSYCGFSKLEGLYFSLSAIAVLILIGMLLPADSHLIGAYIRFRRSLSKSIGTRPQSLASAAAAIVSPRSVLIAASYAAAIIGGVVLAVLLDPVRLWRESRIGVFEIAAAVLVCMLIMVILFLQRKVQALQQILLTAAPPLEQVFVDDPSTGATDRAVNNGSRPAAAWDPGAIKEAFKRKQHEFEV